MQTLWSCVVLRRLTESVARTSIFAFCNAPLRPILTCLNMHRFKGTTSDMDILQYLWRSCRGHAHLVKYWCAYVSGSRYIAITRVMPNIDTHVVDLGGKVRCFLVLCKFIEGAFDVSGFKTLLTNIGHDQVNKPL